MLRVLRAEVMKAQWWLLGALAFAGPGLASILGKPGEMPPDTTPWMFHLAIWVTRYAWLFYPLLAGVFAALLCRTEHVGGGWKGTLSLPVSRTSVYFAKYVLVAGLLLFANLVFGAMFVAAGKVAGLEGAVPWEALGRSLLGGWVAVLPLAALQLWASTRFKSFGGGLALNVCFTLPAIMAAQSADIGPWYPWAQPVLAMMPASAEKGWFNVSPETLWIVIVGGFLVAITAGWFDFTRADVRG